MKYIPIGDKIELNLGSNPEVIFELVKHQVVRSDLTLQINGTNEFRKIGETEAMKEVNAALVGWTDHEVFSQRVRNYSKKDIHVEVRRTLPGHIVFISQLHPKLHDYQTVEFRSDVPAGKAVDLSFEVERRQGRNAKQQNVTLQNAAITP